MDRILAEKITQLCLDEQKIKNEQYEIMRKLNLFSWDGVRTAAMDFLMGKNNEK